MAEITNELMYGVLKALQERLAQMDGKLDETRTGQMAMNTRMIALQHEIVAGHQESASIHQTLVRFEQRLDRIERRLDLVEAPALVP